MMVVFKPMDCGWKAMWIEGAGDEGRALVLSFFLFGL
jgi:hypothetical protein